MEMYGIICSTVDGMQYMTLIGWTHDSREAMLFSQADADTVAQLEAEIAARHDAAQREPFQSRYNVRAVPIAPKPYTLAEYKEYEEEAARLSELYEAGHFNF